MEFYEENGLDRMVQIEKVIRQDQIDNLIENFNGKEISLKDLHQYGINPQMVLVLLLYAKGEKRISEENILRLYFEEKRNELLIIGHVLDVVKVNFEPTKDPIMLSVLSSKERNLVINEPSFSVVDEQGASHNIVYVSPEYTKSDEGQFVEWKSL